MKNPLNPQANMTTQQKPTIQMVGFQQKIENQPILLNLLGIFLDPNHMVDIYQRNE
ncbi:hypothetical protein [Pseudomonas sp. ITEM 17296]|uniref:hypothetical protein n=1 Tax=Pseudomonas sp. ITEM 17296 TaxID=2790281 RepID=UPI0023805DF7|nr:hypothetical protein [Pseudomonas sp. ITEM 17296]